MAQDNARGSDSVALKLLHRRLHRGKRVLHTDTRRSQVDPSLQAVMPIEWVHVPKTGTSFLNTLIHIPGACPGLPADFDVSSFEDRDQFLGAYDLNSLCNTSVWDPNRIVHEPIELVPR